jgi:hypothetical protein
MATAPASMPDQSQGQAGAPPPSPGGGGSAPPDQGGQGSPSPTSAPANPMQMLLARWFKAAKEMASADPRMASGAQKVADGIQEMQTALVTPAQPTPASQQPQY